MMGIVNVCHILAFAHSILCIVAWQSYAHSTNYSNATGELVFPLP